MGPRWIIHFNCDSGTQGVSLKGFATLDGCIPVFIGANVGIRMSYSPVTLSGSRTIRGESSILRNLTGIWATFATIAIESSISPFIPGVKFIDVTAIKLIRDAEAIDVSDLKLIMRY